MYLFFKKIIAFIFPHRSLVTYEELIRYPYAIFYTGTSQTCSICNHKLRQFVNQELCPYCGSLSRHRRLYNLITTYDLKNKKILHFSPPRSMYRRFKKNKNIRYYSTDFENEFLSDYQYDITNIPVEDDFFDFIICYHVLEHIENDTKAIAELYRVLQPNGTLFIQTPFKEGEIYENKEITTPEERLIHFGQEDHVRIYSVDGLKKRLQCQDFTTIKTLNCALEDSKNRYGLLEKEIIFKIIK